MLKEIYLEFYSKNIHRACFLNPLKVLNSNSFFQGVDNQNHLGVQDFEFTNFIPNTYNANLHIGLAYYIKKYISGKLK